MKVAKIREADAAELAKQMADADEQMFRIGMQMRLGQLEGLKKYRVLRKDKARLLTIQRERELAKKKRRDHDDARTAAAESPSQQKRKDRPGGLK